MTGSLQGEGDVGSAVMLSCMLGKHGIWCTFSAITPSFHLFIASSVVFLLARKKNPSMVAFRKTAPGKKEHGSSSITERDSSLQTLSSAVNAFSIKIERAGEQDSKHNCPDESL